MSRFASISVDDALITRARRGEHSAQEQIYLAYHTAVFNLALRITRRQTLAEEVLQDTFFTVLTRFDTYRAEAPLGYWIREIAVNRCLMELRSGWQHRISLFNPEHGDDDTLDSENDSNMDAYVSTSMDLDRALAKLTDTGRAVVWLHDVEGYTHQEIGGLMGKSSSFSKSQLARAHKRLRELLTDRSESEPKCMQVTNNY